MNSYTVSGLIVQISPQSRAMDDYYAEASPAAPVTRTSFEGRVFYLPEGPENDKIRDYLPEGSLISVISHMPDCALDEAARYPGSVTFDTLEVSIDLSGHVRAIDPRPVNQVPETPEFEARIHQVFGGKLPELKR
jgi:hypothetical protein